MWVGGLRGWTDERGTWVPSKWRTKTKSWGKPLGTLKVEGAF